MKKSVKKFSFIYLLLSALLMGGATGKISGIITDIETGDPMIGANVLLIGTSLGAATDVNGQYTIVNVSPGLYDIRVTMIGYGIQKITDIRVEVDLTAIIDASLSLEALQGEMVTVRAERKLVRVDVAASQKSISEEDLEKLPVSSVASVLSLQAGISGFSVRGGSSSETKFMVDGISLNDERTGEPTTGIPLSAIKDISIQTGGFGAEYHNVRSGVVNVVTKEGSDSYSGTIMIRNSPPGQKHFGTSPYSRDSFWLKPFFDDDVAWDGTYNGLWDEYTQRQYPSFDGWNSISNQTLADSDPTNDLTPMGAQKLFTYEHRKNGAINEPDYNIDAGFGGPVPFIGKKLGNLRFFASFRKEENKYLYEVSRSGVSKLSTFLRLTSNLSKTKKLTFSHLAGNLEATALSRGGSPTIMSSVWDLASQVNSKGFTMPWRIFTNDYWAPTTIDNSTTAIKYINQLSSKSFYEVLIKSDQKEYYTWHGARRDSTESLIFGDAENGWYADNAPFGFLGTPSFSIDGSLAFGGAISTSRDTSKIQTLTAKFDYLSQINHHNEIKVGFELLSNRLNLEFGSQNEFLPEGNYWNSVNQSPYRFAFYVQDKLEYNGFVTTLGFNIDHVNPNGEWYSLDVYDESFYSSNYSSEEEGNMVKETIKPINAISPRLAISHPITESSKLYFNYGHFYQMPNAQELYRVQRGNSNDVRVIGDPSLPLAKTVSYELGFDQSLQDKYLVHISAYYKDITSQQDYTQYLSANSKVIYYQLTANSYEDIRGFEAEIAKIKGDWVTGNVNYEYRVNTSGYFGVKKYYENPSDQRDYLLKNPKQSKPLPIPRLKSVIDFHTPFKFGPNLRNFYLLGDWHMNVISTWNAGSWFTYNPGRAPGVINNFQYKNNYNIDIKISKSLKINNMTFKIFADVYNVLNVKNFSGYGFEDGYDYNYYMQSLHLPEDDVTGLGYHNFDGVDQPGDVRDDGVEFVPIEWVSSTENISSPSERAIYYNAETKTYMQFDSDNGWANVDSTYYENVINTKAYIDMPNIDHFIFLNPRDYFFGINVSYDF
ncbi:MAG: TonB-dependent receptor [Candidatus Marinimicrobia bacterium]|nr:TonB-dependent receptor [Candidatus Neomarinimicrobiota bacterium]